MDGEARRRRARDVFSSVPLALLLILGREEGAGQVSGEGGGGVLSEVNAEEGADVGLESLARGEVVRCSKWDAAGQGGGGRQNAEAESELEAAEQNMAASWAAHALGRRWGQAAQRLAEAREK